MKTNILILESDYYARETLAAIILRDTRFKLMNFLTTGSDLQRWLAVTHTVTASAQTVCILSDLRCLVSLPQRKNLHYVLLCKRFYPEPHFLQKFTRLKAIFLRDEIQYNLCHAVLFALTQPDMVVSASVGKTLEKHPISFTQYYLFESPNLPRYLQEVAYLKYQQGFSNQEIEEALCLSKHTLYDYLKQIKQVLGVSGTNSQAQCYQKLTEYALSAEIIQQPPFFGV